MLASILSTLTEHWSIWFVTVLLIVAAVIDGIQLKVPNWLTFPFIISGWIYSFVAFGFQDGLLYSLAGTAVGLALLLPAYAIGGMGAGDAKMMAAIGSWLGATIVLCSFCVGTIVGGIMAVIMIVSAGDIMKHYYQFFMILNEFQTVRDPEELAKIATERKTTMRLLPYGIPMAIGTVLYLAWTGKLV